MASPRGISHDPALEGSRVLGPRIPYYAVSISALHLSYPFQNATGVNERFIEFVLLENLAKTRGLGKIYWENAALSTRRFNPRMTYPREYELKAATMFSTDETL